MMSGWRDFIKCIFFITGFHFFQYHFSLYRKYKTPSCTTCVDPLRSLPTAIFLISGEGEHLFNLFCFSLKIPSALLASSLMISIARRTGLRYNLSDFCPVV